MSIQVSDIIALVRAKLRQRSESGSNWTDAQLLVYLNSVVETVCRETECYRTWRKYTGEGDEGKSGYPLPANCIRVIAVTGPEGSVPMVTLSEINPGTNYLVEDIFEYAVVGAKVMGEKVYFLPALAGVRYLHYYGYPEVDTENADATLDLPVNVKNALVYGVLAECYDEIDNEKKLARAAARFGAEIQSAKSAEHKKQFGGLNNIRRPRMLVRV